MLNSKFVCVKKNDPAGPAWTFLSNFVANPRDIPPKQELSVVCWTDRQQLNIVTINYHAARCGYKGIQKDQGCSGEKKLRQATYVQEDYNY